jgi:hypothetical protein
MDLFHAALKQRLDEAASLTDWQRQMAAGIAAAHPLTPATRVRASGNHLAAQNDEPEPTLPSDDELAEADLQLSIGKGERRAREDAARALDVQLNGSGVRP